MKITVNEQSDISIIALSGDFIGDADHSALREHVRALAGKGKNRLIIDLSDVEYINSSGLGSLVGGLTTVLRSRGEMHLVGIGKNVAEVFRITKLNTIFPIHPSLSAALALIEKPAK